MLDDSIKVVVMSAADWMMEKFHIRSEAKSVRSAYPAKLKFYGGNLSNWAQ
jgi:hypothetical protein